MRQRAPAKTRQGTCRVAATPRGITINGLPLDRFELPAEFRVPGLHGSPTIQASERVRFALGQLLSARGFDRIEFPVAGGLGFRSVQAKRAGLAFGDVTLAVRLDSCGAWRREQDQRWPENFEEIETDFAEQFSFEHADERLTPDAKVLALVQQIGWQPNPVPRERRDAEPAVNVEAPPLVTIGIAHYNLGPYLPETLASLAAQTYPNLEVIVIDDGSTDPASVATFSAMEERYPGWRFLRQGNAGIGATRNRCLELARGEFFIPVDADNLARPEMVERFVTAVRRHRELAAMTCYFLAFETGNPPQTFLHAYRPTGGPHILSCIRNVYGDANAIFRTQALREVGGYETDRGTSCEDWEVFVKLVHAGKRIEVVPDHLFYYRHLADGFSRRTSWFANHNRVLRQFTGADRLSPAEATALWTALLGFHQRLEQLETAPRARRQRALDRVYAVVGRILRSARLWRGWFPRMRSQADSRMAAGAGGPRVDMCG